MIKNKDNVSFGKRMFFDKFITKSIHLLNSVIILHEKYSTLVLTIIKFVFIYIYTLYASAIVVI